MKKCDSKRVKVFNLLIALVVSMLTASAFGQTTVYFNFADPQFGLSQSTNRTVILQAETGPSINGGVTLLPWKITATTDVNGYVAWTNLNGSPTTFYHITIPAPPQRADLDIQVISTNLGYINGDLLIVVFGANTIPSASAAYPTFVSDARYSMTTNTYTNFVYQAQLAGASNSLVNQIQAQGAANTNFTLVTSNLLAAIIATNTTGTTAAQVTNIVNQTILASNLAPYSALTAATNATLGYVTNGLNSTSNSIQTAYLGVIYSASNTVVGIGSAALIATNGQIVSLITGSYATIAQLNLTNFQNLQVSTNLTTQFSNNVIPYVLGVSNITVNNQGFALALSNSLNSASNTIAANSLVQLQGTNTAQTLALIATNNSLIGYIQSYVQASTNGNTAALYAAIFSSSNTVAANSLSQLIGTNAAQTAALIATNGQLVSYVQTYTGTQIAAATNGIGATITLTSNALQTQAFSISNSLLGYVNGSSNANSTYTLGVSNNDVSTLGFAKGVSNSVVAGTNTVTAWTLAQFVATNAPIAATNALNLNNASNAITAALIASNTLQTAANGVLSNATFTALGLSNILIQAASSNTALTMLTATNQILTNNFTWGTNWLNTNLLAQIGNSNYANLLLTSNLVTSASNGLVNLVSNQFILATNYAATAGSNFVTATTNIIGILPGAGSGTIPGTYLNSNAGNVWTNVNNPLCQVLLSGGTFYAQSNSVSMYSWTSIPGTVTVVSGVPPVPQVIYGRTVNLNGQIFIGWANWFTNIVGTGGGSSTNGLATIGYVQSVSNNLLTGINATVPTNGASSGQFYEFGTGWVGISSGTGITTNYGGVVSLLFPLNSFEGTNSIFTNSTFAGTHYGIFTGTNVLVNPNLGGSGVLGFGDTTNFSFLNGSSIQDSLIFGGAGNKLATGNAGNMANDMIISGQSNNITAAFYTSSNSIILGGWYNGIGAAQLGNTYDSLILGGVSNLMNASFSIAAGYQSSVSHPNAFLWSDGSSGVVTDAGDHTFKVNSSNGVYVVGANVGPFVNGTNLFALASAGGGGGSGVTSNYNGNIFFNVGNTITNTYGGLLDVLGLNVVSGQGCFASGQSEAFGNGVNASGTYSFAANNGTVASGQYSTAFGQYSTAFGQSSLAWGYSSYAGGGQSFAGGYNAVSTNNSFIFSDGSQGGALQFSPADHTASFVVSNGFYVNGVRLDNAGPSSANQGVLGFNTNILIIAGFQFAKVNGTYTNAQGGSWTNMANNLMITNYGNAASPRNMAWYITTNTLLTIGSAMYAIGDINTNFNIYYGVSWSYYNPAISALPVGLGYSYAPQYLNYQYTTVNGGSYSNAFITNSVFAGNGAGLTGITSNNIGAAGINLSQIVPQPSSGSGITTNYSGGVVNLGGPLMIGGNPVSTSNAITAQINATNSATLALIPTYATGTNNGTTLSNQFNLYSEQYNAASFQPPFIEYNTWGQYGNTFTSNSMAQTIATMNTAQFAQLKTYAPGGFVIMLDDGMLVRSNGTYGPMVLNPTNWYGMTIPFLMKWVGSNNMQVGFYLEPNDASRNGFTSAGYPDSEGTNIEYDAMTLASEGVHWFKLDPHGTANVDAFISYDQRFESTARKYYTTGSCYFQSDDAYYNGQITDNPNKFSGALPGTILRAFPEYYGFINQDTNTAWAWWVTNQIAQTRYLQGLQHSGQWVTPDEVYNNYTYPLNNAMVFSDALSGTPFIIYTINGMTSQQITLTTNTEILNIAYDPLWLIGQLDAADGSYLTQFALSKPLSDGSIAVGLFNASTNNSTVCSFLWTNIGLSGGVQMLVRDVYNQTNYGVYTTGFTNTLGPETGQLLRLYPTAGPLSAWLLAQITGTVGLTNGQTSAVSFPNGLTVGTNLSSELGNQPFSANLVLDVKPDATNSTSVTSRSPLGQIGNWNGYVYWTNDVWGPAFLAANETGGNGMDFGVNPSWMPTASVTLDTIISVTNSQLIFGYMTNALQSGVLNINNNGYTYFVLNGSINCQMATPSLQAGGRHEVTGTYNSSSGTAVLYVDGQPVTSYSFAAGTTITNISTNHFMITGGPSSELLRGRLWSRALTTNEVAQLYISSGGNQYNGSFTGNGSGLTSIPAGQLTGIMPPTSINPVDITNIVATNAVSGPLITQGGSTAFIATNLMAYGSGGGSASTNLTALATGSLSVSNQLNLQGGWLLYTNTVNNAIILTNTLGLTTNNVVINTNGTVFNSATTNNGSLAIAGGSLYMASGQNIYGGSGQNFQLANGGPTATLPLICNITISAKTNVANPYAITNDPIPGVWNIGPNARFTPFANVSFGLSATAPTQLGICASNADWTTAGITKPQTNVFPGQYFPAITGLTSTATNGLSTPADLAPLSMWMVYTNNAALPGGVTIIQNNNTVIFKH